jgi:hypothetical protein
VGFAGPAWTQNAIVLENQIPGNPSSEWAISGNGDPSIQGFSTDISVNRGTTVRFKIDTDAAAYHLDIYRMGFYGGDGARKVATVLPSATLPQVQPAPLFDPAVKLTDCGNWSESASWDVPAAAVSGIYFARVIRDDTNGASHIFFIVRDDASTSDILFQTADATWQAYNTYGGNSLYVGKADKVSYNRPFSTRGVNPEDWVFNAEYPMVRWLEANGYDVTYFTNIDADRNGGLITQHKVFLSIGHDEYWSAGQRASVTAARDAGVHLMFLSGNEIYWKTRYEPSIDPSVTPYRTLVCYKEGTLGENNCGTKCDPLAGVWTGLWRDGCSPPYATTDACSPENALSGQISWVGSTGTMLVPDTYKNLRFWRNTSVASLGTGATASLTPSSLGYEWDFEQYAAFYPAGRVKMSRTVLGGQTHQLSLYRHSSGALVFGAGTVQWSWGLDGNHDRGASTPSTAMRQATVNLLAEMDSQPGSLQPGLVAATATGDVTPPTSSIGFPVNGGSVPSGAPVTISGTAADVAGVVGVVEVSVDGGTTWLSADGLENWTFSWTPGAAGPVTIMARAADDWGNLESPGSSISVTVTPPAPAVCPCTVWAPATPAGPDGGDVNSIEVGLKFRADADGFVEGVRFHKQAANTGTHVGKLWTSTGTLLGSVTFAGETATGWQEASFAAPIAITANTTYIISVFMPNGHYSFNGGFFASNGVDSPPLHALQNGVDGPNSVYVYTPTGAFPTATFNSSNYWVDLVFNTTSGPDETPPVIVGISPGSGASGVAVTAAVTATFNEAIDPATVDGTTFELVDGVSAPVAGVVTYAAGPRTATFTPSAALQYSATYSATVRGGGADPRIKDLAGNALAADLVWSFTTTSPPPPPPTEGPGGPILVISTATNPFSRYAVEILRTEGFNAFSAKDISIVTPAVIDSYDVVILGEMPLSAPDVTMLTDWTTAGGTLIAFRPDAQLAPLLGLTPVGGTLAEGYLLVNTASGPGVGIVGQTIQYHGAADLYTLNGATSVATLYSNATTATPNPAVTLNNVGGNGGQAIAFTYDLARSIVYTRQGNPVWAGQERDGISPVRSDDQFFGNAAGDPQPDWIDFNKIQIPQADEQQRLLANAIIQGNLDKGPLPRFWYFPSGHKAAIVMTGDDHGDAGMQPRFDIYISESDPGCSVEDWECIRATGYLYVGSGFTPTQAQFYHDLGFEVAVHVNTGCANSSESAYDGFVSSQLAQFSATYPALPVPTTNRNHCIVWNDWTLTPEVEAANGIRFDTNYYYWPGSWIQNRSGMFTGSGMPMRFAKLDGTIIDCFQSTTQMPDESGETFPAFCDQLLDRALGAEGYYGAFTTNMHFDTQNHAGSNAIVASAKARGVPVVSSKQMLDWLDGRNGSSFQDVSWAGNVMTFAVSAATGARNLRGMIPTQATVGQLTGITEDTVPIAYTTETIKGIEYAIFPANTATYAASYAVDTTPPLLTAVSATPHIDGTATITWTTNEASDSKVDYGTDAGTLSSQETDAALVTSHSVTLTGLAASTTYFFRATSTDGASNAATEPDPPAAPLQFTMPAPVCFLDASTADFAAGTPGANTYVAMIGDGDVILRPGAGAEFAVLPPPGEWNSYPWSGGGTSTVSAGQLHVDGARFNSEPEGTTYGPGSSIEFVATFRSVALQHIGFGGGTNTGGTQMFNQVPFALFSTGAGGGALITRTALTSAVDFTIPGSFLDAPHRYRIDWKAGGFDYYIDGALVHTEPIAIATAMRPGISDFTVGGLTLSVDWIHVSPYPSGGSFTSRVYDAGGPANWDQMIWSSQLPAGTSLQMFVRTGNTLVPDGSWSAYAGVPSSGSTVGGNTRYIQYRADLATTDPGVSPILEDVNVGCTAGPDVTPPVITNIVATPGGSGTSALITWDTDELADSRVDYGTSPGSLTLSASDPSLAASHGINLTGLSLATTYYFRVTSEDGATNTSTEPDPPAAPLSFTTTSTPCPADLTAADFQLGTPGGNTAVVIESDGEVTLAPALGSDFEGVAVPAGWSSAIWGGGGSTTVSGGQIVVDGARAYTNASYGPLRSIEFVATFTVGQFQNVGFAADNAFNAPWVVIGEGSATSGVYARSNTSPDILLGAGLQNAPHRYRIDWNATSFDFYVDGVLTATINQTVAGNMIGIISDFTIGGVSLSVDWLRITPYAAAGSFTSRIFDMIAPTTWGAATWNASTPAGTGLSVLVRTGNTAIPDGSWTAFNPVSNGGNIGGNSRYLQYRADLSTSAPASTPVLNDIAIACTPGADLIPPLITNVVATPAVDGLSATITWDTDEPADSRVDYGLSGGALNSSESSATLVTAHSILLSGLTPGTTYDYRVTSEDAALNSSTEPVPPGVLSFATPAQACFTDNTVADFAAGSHSSTIVSEAGDGEVQLGALLRADFAGTALPAGWASYDWPFDAVPGLVTVSGGLLTLDGMRANPDPFAANPGTSLEFVATFSGQANQHIGFGGGNHAPPTEIYNTPIWAMFSTQAGGVLRARTNGPAAVDVTIPGSWLGAPHLFRIDWGAGTVDFFIDGALVHSQSVVIAGPMRPAASDLNFGGGTVTVDWMRLTPHVTPGAFTSRVHDAGGPATWDEMTWTATVPAGTGLSLFVRRGDTPAPDGTWTAFAPIPSSGSIVGGTSRYVQYRADMTTSDTKVTPVLEDVVIACVTCDPTPPPAVADLDVARVTSGGSGGGRIPVVVSFSAPVVAATVEVYRAPFGGYPDYDDNGGVTPPTPSYPPAAPWVLTSVTASGETDDPAPRDAWHYVVFTKSACGFVSAVSNVSAGLPNYLLGDVTDGVTQCVGDNSVATADVSLLGSHYGQTLSGGEGWACLDVGPTLGGSVNGRPLTDRVLQFEDLVMFALNFGATGIPQNAASARRATSEIDALHLESPSRVAEGESFEVVLRMSGAGDVQALSAALDWNSSIVEPGAVRAGAMLESQGGVLFSPGPGRMDAALLGARAQGLAGEGILAIWTFRANASGDPGLAIRKVLARDAGNRPITLGEPRALPVTPATTSLDRVSPNPFTAATTMAFSLAVQSPITLAIYSVDGRRVRRLASGHIWRIATRRMLSANWGIMVWSPINFHNSEFNDSQESSISH